MGDGRLSVGLAILFGWCPHRTGPDGVAGAGRHASMCGTVLRGRRGSASLLPSGSLQWPKTGTRPVTVESVPARSRGVAACWQRGAAIAVVIVERTQLLDVFRSS